MDIQKEINELEAMKEAALLIIYNQKESVNNLSLKIRRLQRVVKEAESIIMPTDPVDTKPQTEPILYGKDTFITGINDEGLKSIDDFLTDSK